MEKHPSTAGLASLFGHYRTLAEKAVAQVDDADLHRVIGADGNSIAVLMRHIAGNMRSRFTDFLTSDGEKPWRDRETEFEEHAEGREELIAEWNLGWACLFTALGSLREQDMERIVMIRNEEHAVLDALHRQLAHYAYHVGQIVLLSRSFKGAEWNSLSIPRGGSARFNNEHGLPIA